MPVFLAEGDENYNTAPIRVWQSRNTFIFFGIHVNTTGLSGLYPHKSCLPMPPPAQKLSNSANITKHSTEERKVDSHSQWKKKSRMQIFLSRPPLNRSQCRMKNNN
jgi:hypothetical protein